MDRYDCYCQICNENIYNAICDWMFREHYECPHELNKWDDKKNTYPRSRFIVFFENNKIKRIVITKKSIPKSHVKKLEKHIRSFIENGGTLTHFLGEEPRDLSLDKVKLFSKKFFARFKFKDGFFESTHVSGMFRKGSLVIRNYGRIDKRRKQLKGWEEIKKYSFPKSISGMVYWYYYSKEEDYNRKARIIKHPTHTKNGKRENGYNMCPKCAEKLSFKCNLCGASLRKLKH